LEVPKELLPEGGHARSRFSLTVVVHVLAHDCVGYILVEAEAALYSSPSFNAFDLIGF
jgi:hypothetical protein